MAKPLNERLTNALTNGRVTITDTEALIPEAEAERDRLLAVNAKAMRDCIDLALSEQDRDAAAALAERTGRTAKALSTAIEQLAEKLKAKRESDAQRAAKARREAAIKVRDELVQRIPAIYAQATGMLIELAREIEASDAELKASDTRGEPSAEYLARGCAGNWTIAFTPVTRLTQIRLPELTGPNDLWPPREIRNFGRNC